MLPITFSVAPDGVVEYVKIGKVVYKDQPSEILVKIFFMYLNHIGVA